MSNFSEVSKVYGVCCLLKIDRTSVGGFDATRDLAVSDWPTGMQEVARAPNDRRTVFHTGHSIFGHFFSYNASSLFFVASFCSSPFYFDERCSSPYVHWSFSPGHQGFEAYLYPSSGRFSDCSLPSLEPCAQDVALALSRTQLLYVAFLLDPR